MFGTNIAIMFARFIYQCKCVLGAIMTPYTYVWLAACSPPRMVSVQTPQSPFFFAHVVTPLISHLYS